MVAAAHGVRRHRTRLGGLVLRPVRRGVHRSGRRGGTVLPGARRRRRGLGGGAPARADEPGVPRRAQPVQRRRRAARRVLQLRLRLIGRLAGAAARGRRSLTCRADPHPDAPGRGVRRRHPRGRRRAAAAHRQPGRRRGEQGGHAGARRGHDRHRRAGHGTGGRRARRHRDRHAVGRAGCAPAAPR